jgi:hypothetical protein
MFATRRCCREDCVGWINDNCFVFLLLSSDYSYKQQQREFDWSKYGLSDTDASDSSRNRDDQLALLGELEKEITQRNSS